jgi:hypothetical protein
MQDRLRCARHGMIPLPRKGKAADKRPFEAEEKGEVYAKI